MGQLQAFGPSFATIINLLCLRLQATQNLTKNLFIYLYLSKVSHRRPGYVAQALSSSSLMSRWWTVGGGGGG